MSKISHSQHLETCQKHPTSPTSRRPILFEQAIEASIRMQLPCPGFLDHTYHAGNRPVVRHHQRYICRKSIRLRRGRAGLDSSLCLPSQIRRPAHENSLSQVGDETSINRHLKHAPQSSVSSVTEYSGLRRNRQLRHQSLDKRGKSRNSTPAAFLQRVYCFRGRGSRI
jgi:hypothetical protein